MSRITEKLEPEATIERVAIDSILIPERLRAVDEDHALAIQTSIQQHGLLNPITVRRTPNGERPLTLVAGAHRMRAIELLEEAHIDAVIVQADALGAALIEIEENLFRNDLSALDRAVFVAEYRRIWEEKYGKIDPKGGRPKNSDKLSQIDGCPVDVLIEEAERGFSVVCAERLGVSRRAVERAHRITQRLPKSLRAQLAGTALADNQSALLKISKLPPSKLEKIGEALDLAEGDLQGALDILTPPPPKPSPEQVLVNRMLDSFLRLSRPARAKAYNTLFEDFEAAREGALKLRAKAGK